MDLEVLLLDRLPLPSLDLYALLSLLAASSSLISLWNQAPLPPPNIIPPAQEEALTQVPRGGGAEVMGVLGGLDGNMTVGDRDLGWEAVHWATQQPHLLWVR
jgi:hypothetical protein